MKRKQYEDELEKLQVELNHLQSWVVETGARIVIVFEGRDAAGKGGSIRALTTRVSPRVFRVVALPKPTEREQSQIYIQRYLNHFPAAGEVVIFDRSWYNRAGVEKVMGFCTAEEHRRFLDECPRWEQWIVDSGITLIKYWLEVSNEEQEKRFMDRIHDPRKHWKLSPMDLEARRRWYDYSKARDLMFQATDRAGTPWNLVRSDDKRRARLNLISHLLEQVPYERIDRSDVDLPARNEEGAYDDAAPLEGRRFVPEKF